MESHPGQISDTKKHMVSKKQKTQENSYVGLGSHGVMDDLHGIYLIY